MSRRPNSFPTYRFHKPSGQAVVTLRLGNGARKDVYLGTYNSAESREEYARILQELAASPAPGVSTPPDNVPSDLAVNELLLAFMRHANNHYRHPDGRPTSEIHNWNSVVRVLSRLYGHTLVREFGPLALKAFRQRLIDDGLCRKTVNRRTAYVRHVFKWGMGEQRVPHGVYTALTSVAGLQRGRTPAHDPEPVGPVDDEVVEATLPFLNRVVAGLVEFQRLTGCRPGEACSLRRCDIDTSREVWMYQPETHKGTWRGKSRIIAVGPKAQELLKGFFTPDIGDYLFSPARAVEEVRARRAANRKTPRSTRPAGGNVGKKKANPRRAPREKYTTTSLQHAVARACLVAFPPPEPLAKREGETAAKWAARLTSEQKTELTAWRRAHHWHVNQLRHSHATRVRKEFDLEHAGASLGHSKMSATEIYAERDAGLAVTVAAKIG